MAKQKLTRSVVERLSPGDADYVVWDAELPGFGVRVKPSGVKSYVVQYRNRETGVSRRKTVGQTAPCSPSTRRGSGHGLFWRMPLREMTRSQTIAPFAPPPR